MSEDLSFRLNHSFLTGIYLAVNAIQDVYLLVDGPNCIFHKAERIHGRHDLFSTILSCSGQHRIQFTGTDTQKVATNYESIVAEAIQKITALNNCNSLFLSSIPFCTIVGTQYDRIIREISPKTAKPVIYIPGRSLEEDWLDGYSRTLNSLAASVDISRGVPKPENVAVVGYLMDRTESDHQANIAEIKRMLKGISLNPVSIWLSNESYGSLQDIKNASVVISFPYAREAARIIAKRIGARVIETVLPFGIAHTQQWLRQIGEALERDSESEAFIEREMEEIVPKLEWIIPHVFLNRRLAWIGDPYIFEGFVSLAEDLGINIVGSFFTAKQSHADKISMKCLIKENRVIFEPRHRKLYAELKKIEKQGVDLVITSGQCLPMIDSRIAYLEFGYPSYYYHALQYEPYLGFRGCLSFVHRMANAVMGSSMFTGR